MKKVKSIHGFTLIEVLVAMSIISIVSMGFYTIINYSIKNNVKNEKDIQALNMAQSEIENLRSQIKSSSRILNIYGSNGESIIEIPNEDHIMWKEVDETNKIDEIEINPNGDYKNYIYKQDNSVIRYYKSLDNNIEYEIRLKLTTQKKMSKYLYNVKVYVSEKGNKFSKKVTTLETSILSK